MWAMQALNALIVLTAPGGQPVDVAPDKIVSLKAPRADANGHFDNDVRCLINTADGKFIAVVEDCETVVSKFEASGRQ
jgi:hypothetical protein